MTRSAMIESGYAPSVRLFEAAACGVPIICDSWKGIEEFLVPGKEILIAEDTAEVLRYLRGFPETERQELSARGPRCWRPTPRPIGRASWKVT